MPVAMEDGTVQSVAVWKKTKKNLNNTLLERADQAMYVSGDYHKAKFLYEVAVDSNPDDPTVLSHYANLLRFIDQPASALVYLEKALMTNPVHVYALYTQVRVFVALGYKYQAMNDFHRTLRLESVDWRTCQQQAAAATSVGWYALCEQVCSKLIAKHPADASAWYTLGVNEQKQYHYQGAEHAYSQSLLYRPSHADALRRRAFCRKKLHDFMESEADMQAAEGINPTLHYTCAMTKKQHNPSSHD